LFENADIPRDLIYLNRSLHTNGNYAIGLNTVSWRHLPWSWCAHYFRKIF